MKPLQYGTHGTAGIHGAAGIHGTCGTAGTNKVRNYVPLSEIIWLIHR